VEQPLEGWHVRWILDRALSHALSGDGDAVSGSFVNRPTCGEETTT
jgi:hypothetical protein